ncbi:MAG: hypothetical protein V4558_14025 [Gemmatimonadota bacterium]
MTGLRVQRPFVVAIALFALVPAALQAQWTVKPGGWFMSHGFNVGRFPDRFSSGPLATENALEKRDWGMYFIYGWKEGLSVGLGQGYARLEDKRDGTSTVTTGFGATGLFLMKRLAQGKGGILSLQPRVDIPLLYNTKDRPVLGPVSTDAEVRLLYGNGFGALGTRGFVTASVGGAWWRTGADELRYDTTVGLDAGPKVLLMLQTFNVAAFQGGGLAYSATKLGGSAVLRVSKSVGIQAGYYGGISGKNTARERTWSVSLWLNHDAPTGTSAR